MTDGFAIHVAKDFGVKDFIAVRKSIASMLSLGIIIAVCLTIISVGYLETILKLLNMKEEFMVQGIIYIRVILSSYY